MGRSDVRRVEKERLGIRDKLLDGKELDGGPQAGQGVGSTKRGEEVITQHRNKGTEALETERYRQNRKELSNYIPQIYLVISFTVHLTACGGVALLKKVSNKIKKIQTLLKIGLLEPRLYLHFIQYLRSKDFVVRRGELGKNLDRDSLSKVIHALITARLIHTSNVQYVGEPLRIIQKHQLAHKVGY